MAVINGSNYEKEWVLDPSEQADKGTRASYVRSYYDQFTGVAAADELYILKLQNDARFKGIEALVGALGAGALEARDKDGNVKATLVFSSEATQEEFDKLSESLKEESSHGDYPCNSNP